MVGIDGREAEVRSGRKRRAGELELPEDFDLTVGVLDEESGRVGQRRRVAVVLDRSERGELGTRLLGCLGRDRLALGDIRRPRRRCCDNEPDDGDGDEADPRPLLLRLMPTVSRFGFHLHDSGSSVGCVLSPPLASVRPTSGVCCESRGSPRPES